MITFSYASALNTGPIETYGDVAVTNVGKKGHKL